MRATRQQSPALSNVSALGRRSVLVTGLATVLTFANPSASWAAHEDGFTDPDSSSQCVTSPSLTALGVVARNQGMSQLDRSDITTSFCGGDIEVRDYYYGDTGWVGLTTCPDKTLTGRCDTYVVKFNESLLSTTAEWKSVGCHEFGYTGGIGHRFASSDADNNSCMRSDINPIYFDTHDLNASNSDV